MNQARFLRREARLLCTIVYLLPLTCLHTYTCALQMHMVVRALSRVLEAMDRALRDLRGKVYHYATLPYGGIVFVIMGDFRQT